VSTRLDPFSTLSQLPRMIEGPGNAADLAERFEHALYNIARGWRHAVDRRLKCEGMSAASWMTIAAASQVRSPLSQSELADMLTVMLAIARTAGWVAHLQETDRRSAHENRPAATALHGTDKARLRGNRRAGGVKAASKRDIWS
jgi:hypothetical protein